jgi:hypothetical protein
MVVLVRHALLLCGVGFDVDDISHSVVDHESGELHGAGLCSSPTVISTSDPLYYFNTMPNAPLKPRLNIWRVRAL